MKRTQSGRGATTLLCALLTATAALSLPFLAPAAARAQESATAAAAPNPDDLLFSRAAVSARRLRPGDTLRVSLTLRNQGPMVARSQPPAPSTVYDQSDRFAGNGFTGRSDGYFVAMTLSGPRGEEWPYRWGIGGDLRLGQSRRLTFPIRLTEPGRYVLYIGVGAGDRIETRAKIIGIEVRGAGQPLNAGTNVSRGVPPVNVTVNGREVPIDQRPIFRESRVLVPIRFVLEGLGATVDYDRQTRRVTAGRRNLRADMTIGKPEAVANGESVHLFPPPLIVNGRTMVPLRFITEALGGTAYWNDRTKTVEVTVPEGAAPRAPSPAAG